MNDPALTPSLASELADVKRRLRNLESSPRLRLSSVTPGGSLIVPNAAGETLVIFGHVQDGDAAYPDIDFSSDGILVRKTAVDDNRQALMWADTQKGWISPPQPVAWQKSSDARDITASTFVAAWSALVAFQSLQIAFNFSASVSVGSTAELRFTVGGSQVGSTLTLSSGQAHTWRYSGLHGAALGIGSLSFAIEARVASGAGTVSVYEPQGTYITFGLPEQGFTVLS
jgi:hypothetical protein